MPLIVISSNLDIKFDHHTIWEINVSLVSPKSVCLGKGRKQPQHPTSFREAKTIIRQTHQPTKTQSTALSGSNRPSSSIFQLDIAACSNKCADQSPSERQRPSPNGHSTPSPKAIRTQSTALSGSNKPSPFILQLDTAACSNKCADLGWHKLKTTRARQDQFPEHVLQFCPLLGEKQECSSSPQSNTARTAVGQHEGPSEGHSLHPDHHMLTI